MKKQNFKITKEQQLEELTSRIPPILNVNIVILKDQREVLLGYKSKEKLIKYDSFWIFPGGRMRFDEKPQETAMRILKDETPGIQALLRRLITAIADRGSDPRAYGVTLYYLFEYKSGTPKSNRQLGKFKWVDVNKLNKVKDLYATEKHLATEIQKAIQQMYSNQDELLVEVDKDNNEIGTISKRDAHSSPTRYHRAAHIMLFNTKGEVVLQQRSHLKSIGGGKWDMPGGHQVAGQSIEQTAKSELVEEMGVTPEIKFKETNFFTNENQSEFSNLYYAVSDGPYGFDKNEVLKIKSFNCEKLLKGDYKDQYDIFDHVYKYTKTLRKIWEKLACKK